MASGVVVAQLITELLENNHSKSCFFSSFTLDSITHKVWEKNSLFIHPCGFSVSLNVMFELFIVIITLFTVAFSIATLFFLLPFHVKIKQLSDEIYEREKVILLADEHCRSVSGWRKTQDFEVHSRNTYETEKEMQMSIDRLRKTTGDVRHAAVKWAMVIN